MEEIGLVATVRVRHHAQLQQEQERRDMEREKQRERRREQQREREREQALQQAREESREQVAGGATRRTAPAKKDYFRPLAAARKTLHMLLCQ